ncbi:MAG: prepilin peptidase, partial [Clostridia bacterium]|nr:prepilin peptidase [Clostridia bacterium]
MGQYILICVYVLAGLLGVCVGSFLNVVIYRLPRGMNLSRPGSHCTKCDYVLKWYDNIPVISWISLGGRCRSCREPISVRYTVVELANMALWL